MKFFLVIIAIICVSQLSTGSALNSVEKRATPDLSVLTTLIDTILEAVNSLVANLLALVPGIQSTIGTPLSDIISKLPTVGIPTLPPLQFPNPTTLVQGLVNIVIVLLNIVLIVVKKILASVPVPQLGAGLALDLNSIVTTVGGLVTSLIASINTGIN